MPPRRQRTLARPTAVSGRGYWTGQVARVEFRPAAANSGRRFVRDDLAGAAPLPALVASRQPATRRTSLAAPGAGDIAMVEHVLAALAGLGVDNCEVRVSASEMPGFDGSCAALVDAIDHAGVVEQAALVNPLVVRRPVRCGDERSWIEARPPLMDGLTIEYRLDYGIGSAIGRQWIVVDLSDAEAFRDEVAAARTFVLESEADQMVTQGLGTHVTTSDLLIFRDTAATPAEREPIENTLRFPDECVRHKVLDVVGDLALAGRPIVGHVVASGSGHRLNADLVEALLATHAGDEAMRRSA